MKYKIFVINLDRSKDRLEKLNGQFQEKGLSFERISAVDGMLLSEKEISMHYRSDLNRKNYYVSLTRGEIGCYLSHLNVCRKIVSENLDYGIILEDDVVLGETFSLVPPLLDSLNIEWNYIKLIAPFKKKKIIRRVPITLNCGSKTQSFELVAWKKPPVGTSAYAVTKKGAEEFLKRRSLFFRPIDVDLQHVWETNLNIMGLLPESVYLLNDKSTIQLNKPKYHYPFARLVYKLKCELKRFFVA